MIIDGDMTQWRCLEVKEGLRKLRTYKFVSTGLTDSSDTHIGKGNVLCYYGMKKRQVQVGSRKDWRRVGNEESNLWSCNEEPSIQNVMCSRLAPKKI